MAYDIGDESVNNAKLEYEKALAKCGMTEDKIIQIKASLRKDKKGRYIFNKKKPYGSVENPVVVGISECSQTLIFDWHNNRWILTDGLGNGWIR